MKRRLVSLLLAVVLLLGMLPTAAAAKAMAFQDVKATDWFYSGVKYAYENGLMKGTSGKKFAPNDSLTRAMFVTILGRMNGVKTSNYTTSKFNDVKTGQWYSAYVQWAAENDIVTGYTSKRFGPMDNVNREQMATILYRYAKHTGRDVSASKDLSKYKDSNSVSPYAKEALSWANAEGLISGMGNKTLAPQGLVTRAQAATILMRYAGVEVSAEEEKYDTISVSGNKDTLYVFDGNHVAREGAISYIDNIVLAFTKPNLTEAQKKSIAETVSGTVVGSMVEVADILQIQVKTTSSLTELEALAKKVAAHSLVYDASVDLAELEIAENSFAYQDTDPWGGVLGVGKNDWWAKAIDAYDAWKEYGGLRAPIKVGVVDSGFDISHSDLNVSFPNEAYRRDNVLDQEKDGSLDNHGTAVAGLIGAKNDSNGMCGVAYGAELVCVDYSNLDVRSSDFFYAYNAILKSGAKIINNSIGFSAPSEQKYNTSDKYEDYRKEGTSFEEFLGLYASDIAYISMQWARYSCSVICKGRDPLFVQSAGNGIDNGGDGVEAKLNGLWCGIGRNTSTPRQFGLSSDDLLSHILVVGAVANQKKSKNYVMTTFSNYGENVDICAPAGYGEIYTTTIGDKNYTSSFGGTSAAAPIVSGAAAFIWSLDPSLTASEVRAALLNNHSVDAVSSDSKWTYPMLDLYAAATAVRGNRGGSSGVLTGKVVARHQEGTPNQYDIPLDNVAVTAKNEQTGDTVSGVTDATGTYNLKVSAAKYTLTFTKTGYKTETGTVDMSDCVNEKNWTVRINNEMVLVPNNNNNQSISGVLLDKDTLKPIARAKVRYWSEMYPEETGYCTTDASGRFSFSGKTVANDWWSLSVEEFADNTHSYSRDDNPTAEGYGSFDGFGGILYAKSQTGSISPDTSSSLSLNELYGEWTIDTEYTMAYNNKSMLDIYGSIYKTSTPKMTFTDKGFSYAVSWCYGEGTFNLNGTTIHVDLHRGDPNYSSIDLFIMTDGVTRIAFDQYNNGDLVFWVKSN